MRPLSALELAHAGLIVVALAVATFVLGIPSTSGQVGLALLGVLVFSVLSRFALDRLLRAAHWRNAVSEAGARRILTTALRAPFYLTAVVLAVVVAMAYLKTKQ